MTYEQCLLVVLVVYALIGIFSNNNLDYKFGKVAFEFLFRGALLWLFLLVVEEVLSWI